MHGGVAVRSRSASATRPFNGGVGAHTRQRHQHGIAQDPVRVIKLGSGASRQPIRTAVHYRTHRETKYQGKHQGKTPELAAAQKR